MLKLAEPTLPMWKVVWREGISKVLTDEEMEAIRSGLESDDDNLVQKVTCTPLPLNCITDWPVEACCVLAYPGWKATKLDTVGKVAEYFDGVCERVDRQMGTPKSAREFLMWYDETPRNEMRRELLTEVYRSMHLKMKDRYQV